MGELEQLKTGPLQGLPRFRVGSDSLYSVLVCGYHEKALVSNRIVTLDRPVELVVKFENYIEMIYNNISKESTCYSLMHKDNEMYELALNAQPVIDLLKQDPQVLNNTLHFSEDNLLETVKTLYGYFLKDTILAQAFLCTNSSKNYPVKLLPIAGDSFMNVTFKRPYTFRPDLKNLVFSETYKPIEFAGLDVNTTPYPAIHVVMIDKNTHDYIENTVSPLKLMEHTMDIFNKSRVDFEQYENAINVRLTGRHYRQETKDAFYKRKEYLGEINNHLQKLITLSYLNTHMNVKANQTKLISYDYFTEWDYQIGDNSTLSDTTIKTVEN